MDLLNLCKVFCVVGMQMCYDISQKGFLEHKKNGFFVRNHRIKKPFPCINLNFSTKKLRQRLSSPGDLAAHGRNPLVLLCSQPDTVRGTRCARPNEDNPCRSNYAWLVYCISTGKSMLSSCMIYALRNLSILFLFFS